MSDLQDAITRLEEILNNDPQRPELLRELGVAYGRVGQHDKAVAMLSLALRQGDPDADLLCALADACLQRQSVQQAAQYYQQAVEQDSRCIEARLGLGMAWRQLGRVKEAVKVLRRVARLKASRDDPRVHVELGLTYQAAGDYQSAAGSFACAIRLGEDDIEVCERLGVVQFRAGHKDQAEHTLARVLERDRARPAALHLMGCIAFQRALDTGHYAPARRYFEEAMALRPNVARTHYYVGRLDKVEGELQQAAAHFEHAHRLDPTDPDALVEMGLLLERAGKHDRAHKAYRRALQHAPTHPGAHFWLGRWFERIGQDRQVSAQYYRRYLELGGSDPELVRHIRQTVG